VRAQLEQWEDHHREGVASTTRARHLGKAPSGTQRACRWFLVLVSLTGYKCAARGDVAEGRDLLRHPGVAWLWALSWPVASLSPPETAIIEETNHGRAVFEIELDSRRWTGHFVPHIHSPRLFARRCCVSQGRSRRTRPDWRGAPVVVAFLSAITPSPVFALTR
jgi:hypothetical protein